MIHSQSIPLETLFSSEVVPRFPILEGALQVAKVLSENNYQVWFVGGCVRDALCNRRVKDIDLVTNATPDQIQELFGKTDFVGVNFGIVLVKMKDVALEVATLRKDGSYTDGRRPDSIEVGTLEEDSNRRDFTINALFYDPLREELLDFHGGLEDHKLGVLRAIGDPRRRFQEDALRLLRAARFAARFQLQIEPETLAAMTELAPTVTLLSGERLQEELTRIICGHSPSRGLRILLSTGILDHILPEVTAMIGVSQGCEFHPEGDVFSHTMLGCECEPSRTKVSRWGILLHDIGKPKTREKVDGKITFYQHEHVGAEMADEILKRLKFSVEERQQITVIVSRHMKFMNSHEWKNSTLRRFLAAKTIEHDLNVHFADCQSCHGFLNAWKYIGETLSHFKTDEVKSPVPESLIGGRDLIALGCRPSPKFKQFLDELIDRQMDGSITQQTEAFEFAREFFSDEIPKGLDS